MDLSPLAELLIARDEIARRTRELGEEIASHYASAGCPEISMVTILKGSFIFLADLVRCVDHPLTVDFMAISSYSQERGEAAPSGSRATSPRASTTRMS